MGLLTNANYSVSTARRLRRDFFAKLSPQRVVCYRCLFVLACVAANLQMACAQGARNTVARTTSLHWENVPIRDAFARLAAAIDEPIFTDRRVDPSRRVSLEFADATNDAAVEKAAASASLGASRLGQLVYFGPPSAAEKLRTLAAVGDESFGQLAGDLRSATKRQQPLEWPRLAEPRELVTKLAKDYGLRIVGAEQIPHDLWPAGRLPPLSLAEQLTVLLIGFDLTFAVDAPQGTITIVPIADPVAIARPYPASALRSVNPEELKRELPNIETRDSGPTILVVGTVEDHEKLSHLLSGSDGADRHAKAPGKSRKLYTLRVEEQPVGNLLKQLGQQLGWTIETDDGAIRAAGLSLDRRVSFNVQNVDEDALLRALLRPAGLAHRRDGTHVRVSVPGKTGR